MKDYRRTRACFFNYKEDFLTANPIYPIWRSNDSTNATPRKPRDRKSHKRAVDISIDIPRYVSSEVSNPAERSNTTASSGLINILQS